MGYLQRFGVQRDSRAREGFLDTIFCVADNWEPDRRKLTANLVLPAGVKVNMNERLVFVFANDSIRKRCPFGVSGDVGGVDFKATHSMRGVVFETKCSRVSDAGRDREVWLLTIAWYDLVTVRFLNCSLSLAAALEVRAKTMTPETRESSRLTMPRYTFPGLLKVCLR